MFSELTEFFLDIATSLVVIGRAQLIAVVYSLPPQMVRRCVHRSRPFLDNQVIGFIESNNLLVDSVG